MNYRVIGFGSPGVKKSTEDCPLLESYLSPFCESHSLVTKELNWKIRDPFKIYSLIYPQFQNSFILESSAGPDELAKYTFIGFDPVAVLSLSEGTFRENGQIVLETGDPLPHLKELERNLKGFASGGFGNFLGGLVGYISYDFVRYLEDLPPPHEERDFPDLQMGLYLDGIVHDRDRESLTYFSYAKDRSAELKEILSSEEGRTQKEFRINGLESDFSRKDFTSSVKKAKDYIYSGDIYQTVLSRKLTGRFRGDQLQAYSELRDINPSPYMYHLRFGDRRVIGSSPEELVSVTGDLISTYPIAGTRPLGETELERERLRTELLTDEKERAEHNMLVDLARNDIGRVAKYGTVNFPEYMEVKKFSHVQHIVSRVTARLVPGKEGFDALGSLFPAGTVSGAPKIRAMEIIDELEVSPRGPYAGAVGYLSFTGVLDSCIAIRSLFSNGDQITLRAGAGIVADSDPEREWEEINEKLAALREAVSNRGEEDGDD